MIGAIIGDVVGSIYEFHNIRTKNFTLITKKNHFTDDTIMTVAIMDWLLHEKDELPVFYLQKWGRKYPSSYGGRFAQWLMEENPQPYYSFGNGSAMRVSPIAYFAKDNKELEELVTMSCIVSHNHPEGIKGAMVVAKCIFKALHGASKEEIQKYAINRYPEIAEFNYQWLKRNYRFDETCQGSVPQAIYCFLISNSFEDCMRTTISIGGDCDTTAAISGAIAGAYYGIPYKIKRRILEKLPDDMLDIICEFKKYDKHNHQKN